MPIKLSKKKVAAYNKSQTTPKTPSKVIPFIDRMRVSINFEPGEMAEEVQSDLPLNFHPAATGARFVFTPIGAG